jgi:hypothetical protein
MSRISGIRFFAAVVTLVVIATLVAAIVVLGPPAKQRELKLDQRRVADLIGIKNAVAVYVRQHEALPADLSVLANMPGTRIARSDPETGASYEYAVLDERSYRLCAVFAAAPEGDRAALPYYTEAGWAHEAGHECFERTEAVKKMRPSEP